MAGAVGSLVTALQRSRRSQGHVREIASGDAGAWERRPGSATPRAVRRAGGPARRPAAGCARVGGRARCTEPGPRRRDRGGGVAPARVPRGWLWRVRLRVAGSRRGGLVSITKPTPDRARSTWSESPRVRTLAPCRKPRPSRPSGRSARRTSASESAPTRCGGKLEIARGGERQDAAAGRVAPPRAGGSHPQGNGRHDHRCAASYAGAEPAAKLPTAGTADDPGLSLHEGFDGEAGTGLGSR